MPTLEDNSTKEVINNQEISLDEIVGALEETASESSNSSRIVEDAIYPGLVLNYNYVLLKKIGIGKNAYVWLVYQISTKRYLAMKVQDFRCYIDGCREITIIQKINECINKEPEKNVYCIQLLDYFAYEYQKDCLFVCSVYDLYAGDVRMVLETGKHKYGLPLDVVKRIVKQLLTSLAFLHNELEIIHTDIKPHNILLKGMRDDYHQVITLFNDSHFQEKYDNLVKNLVKNYDVKNLSFYKELELLAAECVKEICQLPAIVEDEEAEGSMEDDEGSEVNYDSIEIDDSHSENDDDGISSKPMTFNTRNQSVDDTLEQLDYRGIHDLDEEMPYDFSSVLNNRANSADKKIVIDDQYINNCETVLVDFGNAYFYHTRTRHEVQDRRYRAPEVILDLNYGYPCDIWSVGCVVFELATGFVLFEPEDALTKDIQQLYLFEKMLGPLPIEMKKKSKRRRFLFDRKRNYHIKNVGSFQPAPLKERLVKQFLFSEEEAQKMSEFMLLCLTYDPNKRATATQLLNHPWLNS